MDGTGSMSGQNQRALKLEVTIMPIQTSITSDQQIPVLIVPKEIRI